MKNMYLKKALVVGIILFFVGGSVVSAFNEITFRPSEPLNRGWLYVGGSGPGNYTTIQSAIDNANPGDTIFVYNGIYQEQVNVTRSVLLKGQNNTGTIIAGGFNVSKNYTTIQNFNITSGYEWSSDITGKNGTNKAGLYVSSSYNLFSSNHFWNIIGAGGANGTPDNGYDGGPGGIGLGIYLQYSTNTSIISNIMNYIAGGNGGYGAVEVESKGGNGGYGAGINIVSGSSNTISLNTIQNITGGSGGHGTGPEDIEGPGGTGGLGAGIYLQTSDGNNVSFNNVFKIKGGNGGGGRHGGKGEIGVGIYSNLSETNDIKFNNILFIDGGKGGGGFGGGDGGSGAGVLIISSTSNNISYNSIIKITGGAGATGGCESGGYGGGGVGGFGAGISLDSSISDIIDHNIFSNISGGKGAGGGCTDWGGGADGGIGMGVSLKNTILIDITYNTFMNINGGNGGDGSHLGGSGGNGIGIYSVTSTSTAIYQNTFYSITGGTGGGGDAWVGGSGGNGAGIYMYTSTSNAIALNNFSNITGGAGGDFTSYEDDGNGGNGGIGAGILLNSSPDNTMISNIASNVSGGIGGTSQQGANGTDGIGYGVSLISSSGNLCYNNYFSHNTINGYDDGNNTWNIAKTLGTNIIGGPYLGGNYWDDYTGKDNNTDGIGDTPYNISGGDNQDVYPLIFLNTYMITASASSGGIISPGGAVIVFHGMYQNFTITADLGYHIVDVLVDGGSVGAVPYYNFTDVQANHTIHASFAVNQYKIIASAGIGGTIDPSGDVYVSYGGYKNFTITPDTGFHITSVLVDDIPVGAVFYYNFTNVQSNHTIAASFAINQCTIIASAGSGGSINPVGDVVVDYGGYQNFSITPDSEYHVVDVLVDGGSVGAVSWYNFTNVQIDHSINASFAQTSFTIFASAGSGGAIYPSGAVVVAQGGYKNFTITPNTGYYRANVLVDGVSVGIVPYYNFTDVQANHTIHASFGGSSPPTPPPPSPENIKPVADASAGEPYQGFVNLKSPLMDLRVMILMETSPNGSGSSVITPTEPER
jgi:hypothetical protein